MTKQERFEVKKPNKDDHKGIQKAADIVKQVFTFGGLTIVIGSTIKKYGPKLVSIITKK